MPSSAVRSEVPISSASIPSTAAIAAALRDRLRALDHRDHQHGLVQRGLRLGIARRLEAEHGGRPAPAAVPDRRIAERLRDLLGALHRVDMRHDHAERAVVEAARALIERVGADAHDRRHAGRQRGDADLRRVVRRDRAVLHVDEQPVVVGRGRDHAGRAGAQMMHAEAERELVVLQLELGFVLEHGVPLPGARMRWMRRRRRSRAARLARIACSPGTDARDLALSRAIGEWRTTMQNSEKIWQLVDARKDDYEALSDRVWGMPEIAYTRVPLGRRASRDAGAGRVPHHRERRRHSDRRDGRSRRRRAGDRDPRRVRCAARPVAGRRHRRAEGGRARRPRSWLRPQSARLGRAARRDRGEELSGRGRHQGPRALLRLPGRGRRRRQDLHGARRLLCGRRHRDHLAPRRDEPGRRRA